MTRSCALGALLLTTLCSGYAQVSAKGPAFEVASITPCKPGTPAPPWEHAGIAEFTLPGGRFTARATTVSFLLEWAYGIQPFQHSRGPEWLDTDRYDIAAKAEGNASEDQMKRMARALLDERFHLQLHHETRKLPAYVVSLGKTAPKLYPPKEGEVHALRLTPEAPPGQKFAINHVKATRYSLEQLTDAFARQLGRVVVNKTGLTGEFDFTVDLAPDETRPNPLDPSLLVAALRDQLGLKVKSQTAPVDFLVIDSAEKVAAGN